MLLHFPQMHPELLTPAARAALPQGALFLDPGLAKPGSPEHMRPESAPFDQRMAKALLADTLRFGESVASPRDILPQGLVQQAAALNPESSRAVQAEVERSVLGAIAPESAEPDAHETALRQAQMVLLLAWSLEERMLDLRGAEEKLQTAWNRLDQSVAAGEGEGDDETDHEALSLGRELFGLTLPMSSSLSSPWRKLLECYAVLAPEAQLATTEAEIGAALSEAGVPEAALSDMPGAQRVFRAQAWCFMGLDRLPEARPWLDAMLTLGVYAPAEGE